MNARLMAAAIVIATWGSTASAQLSPGYPQYGAAQPYNPYSFGPTNPYNRTNQPLSPYLNLLRGGNPAVNYAYGVRPGTTGAGGFGGGAPMMAMGAQQGPIFSPQALVPDVELPTPEKGYILPPAGHPVLFNNTLGYYPSAFGQRGQARPAQTGASGGSRATGGAVRR